MVLLEDSNDLPTIQQNMLHDFTAQTSQDYHNVQLQDTTSSSCPPRFIPKQEYQSGDSDLAAYVQDRVKKDNHNRIERKRRYNINDRIKELGTLIPKSTDPHVNRDMRWNKGSILKASVDHMKQLQKKVSLGKQAEMEAARMRKMNQQLLLRMRQLEIMAQNNGLNVPAMEESQDMMKQMMQSDNLAHSPSFSIDQEADIAGFPSAVVTSPSGQTFSPGNSSQQSRSMTNSPQQFIYHQPSSSYSQSPQHNIMVQPQPMVQSPQPAQIVTIDITSPGESISPQPTTDFTSVGIAQTDLVSQPTPVYNQNQSLNDLNMPSFDFEEVLNQQSTTNFTDFLNNPTNETLSEILMEDDSQDPIKSDIFLSEAIPHN